MSKVPEDRAAPNEETPDRPAAAALADILAATHTADLGKDARHAARRHIADALGVMVASSALPFGRRLRSYQDVKSGNVTAFGLGRLLPRDEAGLVNGILAHGLDYDDTHFPSVMHPGCVVIPTALAVAESLGASDDRIERAVIGGYEASTRLGAAAPAAFHLKGYHPTSVLGTLAGAVTCALLQGFDATALCHTLGVAGSLGSGIMQFLDDGVDTKRIHAGWAVHAGIRAVDFVQMGFQGPVGVIDGRLGMYATHVGLDQYDAHAILRPVDVWSVTETSLKRYACCHYLHAHIDALLALMEEHDLRPEDVDRIRAGIHKTGLNLLTEPSTETQTSSSYSTQFSLAWALAATLTDGAPTIATFVGDRWKDPALHELARRVECYLDEDSAYPLHYDGVVEVFTTDGRVLKRREVINRGSPGRPLTDDEVAAKFTENLQFVGIDAERARSVADELLNGKSIISAVRRANELTVAASNLTPTMSA
jgi:2-methylcitrate dehydratase PrpD